MRSCKGCAKWSPIARHGRGTETGWCTDPQYGGRVRRSDDACRHHVPHDGTGFDVNVALTAFHAFKRREEQGEALAFDRRDNRAHVDTDELRARSARYQGRRVA